MNELMVHVEKIVRPVRAFQRTKLRMRRELLAHLQASFDEELQSGCNQQAAFERAVERLGSPTDLTQNLQRSAPILERVLMARMPAPRAWNRWERNTAGKWKVSKLTMLHSGLLLLGSILLTTYAAVAIGIMIRPFNFSRPGMNHPVSHIVASLLIDALAIGLFAVNGSFAVRAAGLSRPIRRRDAIGYSMRVTAVMLIMTLLACGLASRYPTTGELLGTFAIAIVLMTMLYALGRSVGVLRRPYDEWLGIELAA